MPVPSIVRRTAAPEAAFRELTWSHQRTRRRALTRGLELGLLAALLACGPTPTPPRASTNLPERAVSPEPVVTGDPSEAATETNDLSVSADPGCWLTQVASSCLELPMVEDDLPFPTALRSVAAPALEASTLFRFRSRRNRTEYRWSVPAGDAIPYTTNRGLRSRLEATTCFDGVEVVASNDPALSGGLPTVRVRADTIELLVEPLFGTEVIVNFTCYAPPRDVRLRDLLPWASGNGFGLPSHDVLRDVLQRSRVVGLGQNRDGLTATLELPAEASPQAFRAALLDAGAEESRPRLVGGGVLSRIVGRWAASGSTTRYRVESLEIQLPDGAGPTFRLSNNW